jgi:Tfp pilus assembly protein PilV
VWFSEREPERDELKDRVEEKEMEAQVKNRQERGFTLLETAAALLVMMIGGLGICAVFTYAIRNNTGSRDRAAALAVAQQQMEYYRNLTFLDPALTATVANPNPVTVSSAGRTYSVRTTITDTTSSLKTIKIQVTPLMGSDVWALGTVEISVQRSAFALGPYSGGP